MKHIVYLLEIQSGTAQTKYIGQKSNAQVINGNVISDGKIYLTSTTSSELQGLLSSGTPHTFSLLAEFDDYQSALQYERDMHILNDVVASPEYFNKAIATVNNFSDPNFSTYKHINTGKTVRLQKDHAMVLSGEYVGVQKGVIFSEEERKKRQRSGKSNPFYGKEHTQETKSIIGEKTSVNMTKYYSNLTEQEYNELCAQRQKSATGLKKSAEWVESIKGACVMKNPETGENKRIYASEREYYSKLGWVPQNAGVKQKAIICPHCGKEGSEANMRRWHYNNCKSKNNQN